MTRTCFMCGQDVEARSNGQASRHPNPHSIGDCSGSLMPVVDGVCDERCGQLWPGCGHSLTKDMTAPAPAGRDDGGADT